MDVQKITEDIKILPSSANVDPGSIEAALRLAGTELSQLVDIPELNYEDSLTVTTGTTEYAVMPDAGLKVDRITSAVFVKSGTAIGQMGYPLVPTDIASFNSMLYGSNRQGLPHSCTYFNGYFKIYPIPTYDGTIYYTAQKVFDNLVDVSDSFIPLVYWLTRRNLIQPKAGSGRYSSSYAEWQMCSGEITRLLRTFRGRIKVRRQGFDITDYRAQRVKELNNLHYGYNVY